MIGFAPRCLGDEAIKSLQSPGVVVGDDEVGEMPNELIVRFVAAASRSELALIVDPRTLHGPPYVDSRYLIDVSIAQKGDIRR
jgi:hypothetical protein